MRAVFKRELTTAFHRLYGYVTVSLTLIIAAVFFALYNLQYTSDTIILVLSAVYIPVSLIIPVIAAKAFPGKGGVDTDAIYDYLPISGEGVFAGKLAALLTLTHIPTALMALLPIISGTVAPADHGISYSALLGLLLFQTAWLAVCTFISVTAKTRARAYVWSYATIAVIFILSIFGGAVKLVMDKLSLFSRIDIFFGGIFDVENAVFFAAVSVVFFYLAYRSYTLGRRKYTRAANVKRSLSLAMVIVIISVSCLSCVAAAIAPNRYLQLDVTGAKKFSVSEKAESFLSGVDKEVTIYHLEPSDMSSLGITLDGYSLYLESLAGCSDSITVERLYYEKDPTVYRKFGLSADTVNANSLLIVCADNGQYLDIGNMVGYTNDTLGMSNATYSEYQYYGSIFSQSEDYQEYLYSLLTETYLTFNGDAAICEYIEFVTADVIPQSYYLTGHGERDTSLATDAYYGIGLSPLNISEGDVPADAASVFINMPTNDISSAELDRLLDYLGRGGQVTVVTDKTSSGFENIARLMAAYGMSASGDVVSITPIVAEDAEDAEETEDGEQAVPSATFVPTVDCDNDLLTYLDGTDLSFEITDANHISCSNTSDNTLQHYELISAVGKEGSFTVACAAETANSGRLVWFTGGEAFNSTTTNARLVVAFPMLYWVTLVYSSQLDSFEPVIYQTPTGVVSDMGATAWVVITVGAPVVLLIVGVIAFYRRKKAK